MRINVYGEELTEKVEIIKKAVDQKLFYGVRFYLKSHQDLHSGLSDNDESAVTFWIPFDKKQGNQFCTLREIFNHALDQIADAAIEEAKRA